MKRYSLSRHLTTTLVILAASYALFTFLPGIMPHPEDFGPWAYLVACVVVLAACIRLPNTPHRWAYWLILLLCTLAFLDEAGYGVEVFGWRPLYLQQYHVEIRDLHNLIGLGFQLAKIQLRELHWDGAEFARFMLFDLGLVLLTSSFLWLARRGLAAAREAAWHDRILGLTSGAATVIGLAAISYLLTLPADPKNAAIFGYSIVRLGSVLIILVVSFLPLAALRFKSAVFKEKLGRWLKPSHRVHLLTRLTLAFILIGLAYQCYAPFVFLPDQKTRLIRITPLVLWALAETVLSWTALVLWSGKLRQPFRTLWTRAVSFWAREPAFFYTAFALALITLAQFIDVGVFPLNQLIVTPNFHVELWGLWTEEIFETTAAYIFILAAWVFPAPSKARSRGK